MNAKGVQEIMAKVRVGVAGYGTIGQRLADGVARQGDMELTFIWWTAQIRKILTSWESR